MQPRRKRERFKERFAPAVGYWDKHWESLEQKIRLCMMRRRKGAAEAGKVTLNDLHQQGAFEQLASSDK